MKSLLELYGQQFRNTIPDADSQDYTTSDVFGQMATNKRRAEYDNSLLGIVHNWATGEQRQPVQLPDDASWLDQAKEAGARFLNLPNDMAAGGAKTMAHWLGAAGSPEMVEPQDMLAPLGIGAMAGLGGVVPRGAVGSAGGKLANGALDMSHEARMQRAREMGFSDFTGYSDALAKTEKLRADRDAAYRALGPAARELNGYGWDYDRALADARYFHEARPTAGSKEKLDMLTAPGVAEAAAVYRAAQRPLRQMDRTLEVSDAVERMIDASFKERPMDQGGRVYHGAPEKFVTYDAEKARALNNSGGTRSGSEDVAFVSTGRGMAENFGNEVMSLDLKPGRYFDPANDYDLANLAPYINGRPSPNDIWDYLLKSEPNKTNWPWLESEPVVSELRRLGYDGVKMSGAIDTERGLKPHEFYGVFSRGKVTHADPEMNGATFFADQSRASLPGLLAGAADEPRGITAYHGSPHDFDKFSLDKIGTGEGAQAYGHGLYFAESEGVAQRYREDLSYESIDVLKVDGKPFDVSNPLHVAAYVGKDHADWLSDAVDRGRSINIKSEDVPLSVAKRALNHLRPTGLRKMFRGPGDLPRVTEAEPGHTYEVRINADPNDFLDWDKPLSQQSEKVRGAFSGVDVGSEARHAAARALYGTDDVFGRKWSPEEIAAVEAGALDHVTGGQAYSKIRAGEVAGDKPEKLYAREDRGKTNQLRDAGIPGIRYLDQGSRTAGDGSRNYVVFDDALVEILRKYGLLGMIGGGSLLGSSESEASPAGGLFGVP